MYIHWTTSINQLPQDVLLVTYIYMYSKNCMVQKPTCSIVYIIIAIINVQIFFIHKTPDLTTLLYWKSYLLICALE